jgi:hypothetical protein
MPEPNIKEFVGRLGQRRFAPGNLAARLRQKRERDADIALQAIAARMLDEEEARKEKARLEVPIAGEVPETLEQLADRLLMKRLQEIRTAAEAREPSRLRKMTQPVREVAGAGAAGFQEGFGNLPIGTFGYVPPNAIFEEPEGTFEEMTNKAFKEIARPAEALIAAGEVGLRGVAGIFHGGVSAFRQMLIEAGVSDTTAKKFTFDLATAIEASVFATGGGPGPMRLRGPFTTKKVLARKAILLAKRDKKLRLRIINQARREARRKAKTREEADIREAQVEVAIRREQDLEAQIPGVPYLRSPDKILDDIPILTEEVLAPEIQRQAMLVAQEVLLARGIKPNSLTPTRVQQIIVDILASEPEGAGASTALFMEIEAAGMRIGKPMSRGEFLDAFLGTGSEAGRTLQIRSQFFAAFHKRALRGDKVAQDTLATMEKVGREKRLEKITPFEAAHPFMKNLTDIFRMALVSPPVTAVRNMIESGILRQFLSTAHRAVDTTLRRTFTPNAPIEPILAFDELGRFFIRNKFSARQIDTLMKAFPQIRSRLFAAVEADLMRRKATVGGGFMDRVRNGVSKYGLWMNRAQEFLVRKHSLASSVDRKLRAIGSSLEEVVDEGIVPAGFYDALSEAIEESLFVTFALDTRGVQPLAKFFKGYATVIEESKVLVYLEPFPRFLFNAAKLVGELTPTAGLRLITVNNRAKIAAGEFDVLARELVASGIFAIAIGIRQGDFPGIKPGERYDEVVLADGNTVSIAPFVTLGYPLFMADLIIRLDEGRIQPSVDLFRMIRRGVFSSAPQVARGSSAMEEAFKLLAQIKTVGDLEKLSGFVGETATGYLRPFSPLRDFRAEWNEAVRIQREVRGRGFWAPIQAVVDPTGELGVFDEPLPERESPTRIAPPKEPRKTVRIARGDQTFRKRLGLPLLDDIEFQIGAGLLSQFSGARLREPRVVIEKALTRQGFTAQHLSPKMDNKRLDALVARYQAHILEPLGAEIVSSPMYIAASNKVKQEILRNLLNYSRSVGIEGAKEIAPKAFGQRAFRLMPGTQREAFLDRLEVILKESGTGVTADEIIQRGREAADAELKAAGL